MTLLTNLPPVQNFLAHKTVEILSTKLQTKISVKNVRFHLLNVVSLEQFYVEDQKGDTLLYAGAAELRISDWFIFTDKPVISHIGLKDAYVYINRPKNDAQWNLQFLLDAFATEKKPKKASSSTISLDLKKATLNNVHFQMKDQWVGSDMEGSVGRLVLNARELDFKKKNISLKSLFADRVVFGLTEYTGGRPTGMRPKPSGIIDTSAFNPGLWKLSLDELNISNNRFFLEYPETAPPPGLFDENHLDITGINMSAKDLKIVGDTIKADLQYLNALERCGLEIKKMTGQITVSPNISEVRELYLETGNSILRDYYAMEYERFPDFIDYIDKVRMKGNLVNAEVGIKDITYFAPALKRYQDLSVKINGKARGTVNQLNASEMNLDDGLSVLKGNLSMDGLPDIHNTFIDFRNGELATNGQAAIFYAPTLKHQTIVNISALKEVVFKGSFTGYISDFVAYGDFKTNLGNLHADVNMKLPTNALPSYSGSLQTKNFNIGMLFFQEYAGNITFDAEVEGTGFSQKDVEFGVDGVISDFFVNNYNYTNLVMKGQLKRKQFDGSLKAADPNLLLDFNGKINASGEKPVYDFSATVDYINTKQLHWTDNNISGSAEVKLNLTGQNIDDFIGTAEIYNMHILRDSTKLNLDAIRLASTVNDKQEKQLSISTNDVYATISGAFSIMQLPSSFQLFLSYYLPEYISPPNQYDLNQNFQFELSANSPDDILSLFDESIHLGNNTFIAGEMDISRQQLAINGKIPEFNFKQLKAFDIEIHSEGTYSGLATRIRSNNIAWGTKNLTTALDFTSTIFRDSAYFQLNTLSSGSFERASLNGIAYAQDDRFYLSITPSEFYLNNERWQIKEGNSFVIGKDYLLAKNLQMTAGPQKIAVNVSPQVPAPNNALVKIESLDLSLFDNFLEWDDFRLNGLLNGTINIQSVTNSPSFEFKLRSGEVSVNNDTIGIVRLNGKLDLTKKLLQLETGSGIQYKDASARISGMLNFDGTSSQQIKGAVVLNNAEAAWISPFVQGYVRDISGKIDGYLDVEGPISNFTTKGNLKLQNSSFTPDIIGARYRIKDGTIKVMPNGFSMDEITVFDDEGNEGILTGTVTHQQLKDFRFSLRFNSDNIQVINLSANESDLFYGKVFSSVQARLNGLYNDLSMNIFATPQKNSSLYIPIGYGSDLGTYSYIHFTNEKKDSNSFDLRQQSKINIRLDAVATPDLETTIILDPSSGDRIVARGSGNIILEIPANDDLKMNGSYVIEQGTYDFSFKQLQILNYKRQFTINPNSSIKWNGDITDADLDVSAYATVKARLYDLIQGETDRLGLSQPEIKDAQIAQNVNVLLKMKGSLSAPDMKFNLELTEGRSIGTYAYQRLQRINTDEKELLNQVASLLLLDQFVPPEGISNTAIAGTINNMSELLSSALSSQATNFANKILGMSDLTIGVRYKSYSLSNGDPLNANYLSRNEAGLNLRKNFFENRLIVEVGGVYDWGRTVNQNSFQDNLAGDFRIQYLLTEDGRIRLEVFRNSNYDALSLQNISRQGLGLNYRKSFNGIQDFIRPRQLKITDRERDDSD